MLQSFLFISIKSWPQQHIFTSLNLIVCSRNILSVFAISLVEIWIKSSYSVSICLALYIVVHGHTGEQEKKDFTGYYWVTLIILQV